MNNNIALVKKPQLAVIDGSVKTTTCDVAEKFSKQHKDVLRAVREVDCSEEFAQRNFALGSYKDGNKQDRPMYEITRDGFCYLIMGFTGKEAAKWKEAYINAFNTMETELNKLPEPKLDIELRRRLRDQKMKLVKLVSLAKTQFEQAQYLADLKEVCIALEQPLPDENLIGMSLPEVENKA
ncbi:Rha family transcriptional regulator [Endozoicomonas sp. ALD040]|uniref:Rha family transcriptional regulator n=1 Tax=Endozoicomonas sp. ALD040 TaxID=3403079 RepID=UPI003BAEB403